VYSDIKAALSRQSHFIVKIDVPLVWMYELWSQSPTV